MTTLKAIIDANQEGALKKMNLVISKLGSEHDKPIFVGESVYEDEAGEVHMAQSVEMDNNFNDVMKAIGVTIQPSLEELEHHFYTKENYDDVAIQIVSEEASYKGTVSVGIMGKTLSLWTDVTEWEEIEVRANQTIK